MKRRAPLRRTGFASRGDGPTRKPMKRKPAPHIAAGFTLAAKGETKCRNCSAPATDPHHAVPRSLSRRGRADLRNLIGLCRRCHDAWHAGTPFPRSIFTAEEWAFLEEIAPSQGWLGRRYPRARRDAA